MVKDTELYDLLGVSPDADEIALKKAYRKQAIKFHPDKNPSPDAASMFQEISEAYQILSDDQSRAFYDKVGRAGMKDVAGGDGEGGMGMMDPSALFGSLFGGERFRDWIGEISLVKDFAEGMDVMMSEEEKEEMMAGAPGAGGVGVGVGKDEKVKVAEPLETETAKQGENIGSGSGSAAAAAAAAGHGSVFGSTTPSKGSATTATTSTTATADSASSAHVHAHSHDHHHHDGHLTVHGQPSTPSASGTSTPPQSTTAAKQKEAKHVKPKLSEEQRAKLAALDEEKEKARKARIDTLVSNLIARIRPFVTARHPGDASDPETAKFEASVRLEAEDLKLESFGVELLHTIGNVYITKASLFIKSKKFFGGGFLGRLKEKGSMLKEGWGILGSAIGVQMAMEELAKIEAKGDASQEELEALAQDLSSKLLLTTWKGTRWEVISVVGEVVERVLHDPTITKEVALNRAKAIMTIGGIFKGVVPDESDEERRELERLVLNAGSKKKAKENKEKKEREKAGWGWSSKKEPTTSEQPAAASGTAKS